MLLITIVLQHPIAQTRIVLECPSDLAKHRFGPRPNDWHCPLLTWDSPSALPMTSTNTNTNLGFRIMQSPVFIYALHLRVSVLSASQEGIMLATWIAPLIN